MSTCRASLMFIMPWLSAAALAERISVEQFVTALILWRLYPGGWRQLIITGIQYFYRFCSHPGRFGKVPQTLSKVPHRKLITLFGCPGDRDRHKDR